MQLPEAGWGLLLLTGNAPRVGAQWTDSGTTHDERHLKHRAKKATRPVPVPPELVRLLRAHLDRFGTAPDGRLFRGARGAMLSESSYGRIWQRARLKALTSAQARSPLAARPYDLRHSGVTLQLNAGVPAPEVAGEPVMASRSCCGCTPDASKVTSSSGTAALMMRSATMAPDELVSPWFRRQP